MTVAIIGASTDRRKYGNKAVRAWLRAGETVVPVNPKGGQIEGIEAYRSVLDYPGEIDMASLYLPPRLGIGVLGELRQKAGTQFDPEVVSAFLELVDSGKLKE